MKTTHDIPDPHAEATLDNIFRTQTTMFAEGETMLEDYCIKALDRGVSVKEIVAGVEKHYRQCQEVALANIERARLWLSKHIAGV